MKIHGQVRISLLICFLPLHINLTFSLSVASPTQVVPPTPAKQAKIQSAPSPKFAPMIPEDGEVVDHVPFETPAVTKLSNGKRVKTTTENCALKTPRALFSGNGMPPRHPNSGSSVKSSTFSSGKENNLASTASSGFKFGAVAGNKSSPSFPPGSGFSYTAAVGSSSPGGFRFGNSTGVDDNASGAGSSSASSNPFASKES